MRIAHEVRLDVRKWTALARDAPGQLIDRLGVKGKAMLSCLVNHPKQKKFGKATFQFGVSTTNIGVHSRKPNLLYVLWLVIVCLAEAIAPVCLWFIPAMKSEHSATLIERDCLPKDPH